MTKLQLTRDEIRRVLTKHGYTKHEQPDGSWDFHPYVYAAAKELLTLQRERCAKVAAEMDAPTVAGRLS